MNADGAGGLNGVASTVAGALRMRGLRVYSAQVCARLSTPRSLSSSSHCRASGVISSSLGTSEKALENLFLVVP